MTLSAKNSLWLRLKPRPDSSGASSEVDTQPSWVEGIVTEVLGDGWVEVEIPADSPETRATGPTDGLLTQVGARVRVLLDPRGRVLQISSPQKIDTGRPTEPTGAAGSAIQSALDKAGEALQGSEEIKQRAQEAAQSAQDAFQSAQRALEAAEKSTETRFSVTAPESPKEGTIWYQLDASGRVVGVKVFAGGHWVPRPLVADQVLVPGSVGDIALKDGAITAPKISASQEMWAALAKFDTAIVDRLIAQNATIPGSLVGGVLSGNRLVGSSIEISENEEKDAWPRTDRSSWFALNRGEMRDGERGWRVYDAPATPTPTGFGAYARVNWTVPTGVDRLRLQFWFHNHISSSLDARLQINVRLKDGSNAWINDARLDQPLSHPTTTLRVASLDTQKYPIDRIIEVRVTVDSVPAAHLGKWLFSVGDIVLAWGRERFSSSIKIYRNAHDQASIEMTSPEGSADLQPQDLIYRVKGSEVGKISWHDLIAPPVAVVTWAEGAGADAAKNADGVLSMSARKSLWYQNKFTVDRGYLIPPKAGWYQVNAACGFVWGKTEWTWAVSCGIRRSGASKVDWINDPAGTLPLVIPNITMRPTASGLIHLAAGEGITLAFWQNTGSWRPNRGESTLSMFLVDAD